MKRRLRILLFFIPLILLLAIAVWSLKATAQLVDQNAGQVESYLRVVDDIYGIPQELDALVGQFVNPGAPLDQPAMDSFSFLADQLGSQLDFLSAALAEFPDGIEPLAAIKAEWQDVRRISEALVSSGTLVESGEELRSELHRKQANIGLLSGALGYAMRQEIRASQLEITRQRNYLLSVLLPVLLAGVLGYGYLSWKLSQKLIGPLRDIRQSLMGDSQKSSAQRGNPGAATSGELGQVLQATARSLQLRAQEARVLGKIERALSSSMGNLASLAAILEICTDELSAICGAILERDPENGMVACAVKIGFSDKVISKILAGDPHSPLGKFLNQELGLEPQFIEFEPQNGDGAACRSRQVCAVIPIQVQRQVGGLLLLCRLATDPFTEDHISLAVALAAHAAELIEREQHRHAVERVEARYQELFDRMPIGLYRVNARGKILQANPAALQMLGYSSLEEMKGMRAHELYAKRQDYREWLNRFNTADAEADKVSRFRRRDGSEIWVQTRARLVASPSGSTHYFEGVLQDITARKLAEDALREGEERLRSVLQSTNDAIISFNEQGQIIFWNEAAERIFGYDAQQAIHRKLDEMIIPDFPLDQALHLGLNGNGNASGKVIEATACRQSGEVFPIELTLSDWHAGGERFITGIMRDISKRKADEVEIRKLSRAIEQSSSMVIITDPQGSIEYINPKFCSVSGYALEEVIGRSPRFLQSGETSAGEYQQLWSKLKQGEEWHGVFCNSKKNGEQFWTLASITPLLDDHGRISHYLAVEEDITERRNADERIRRQLSRLRALRAVDDAISASLDPQVTFNVLLQHVIKQLGVDAACVLMFNQHTQDLEFASGVGFNTRGMKETRLRIGKGFAGKAALERRMVRVPDLESRLEEFARADLIVEEGFKSYFALPLNAKGQVRGLLELFHRSPLDPDAEWLEFLAALGAQGAIAIDNAALFEDLQRSNMELTLAYESTLEGWAKALELRDSETEGHTRRVSELTVQIARQMGIRDHELRQVRRGAILHDIGKMAIPDRILSKPGPLSDAEWMIMRRHPEYAYSLLSDVGHLESAIEIPLYHHEKWDGSGYPHGLEGDQIPLAARIFAIVDVWDALLSDRPYRKAWPRERALSYIEQQAGAHFDAKIVELFVRLAQDAPPSSA